MKCTKRLKKGCRQGWLVHRRVDVGPDAFAFQQLTMLLGADRPHESDIWWSLNSNKFLSRRRHAEVCGTALVITAENSVKVRGLWEAESEFPSTQLCTKECLREVLPTNTFSVKRKPDRRRTSHTSFKSEAWPQFTLDLMHVSNSKLPGHQRTAKRKGNEYSKTAQTWSNLLPW